MDFKNQVQINKGNFVVLSKIILSLEWFKLNSLRIWATLFTLIWPLCNDGLKGIHTIYSIYKTHGYTQKQQVLFYLSTCCGSYKKAGSEPSSPFSSNPKPSGKLRRLAPSFRIILVCLETTAKKYFFQE